MICFDNDGIIRFAISKWMRKKLIDEIWSKDDKWEAKVVGFCASIKEYIFIAFFNFMYDNNDAKKLIDDGPFNQNEKYNANKSTNGYWFNDNGCFKSFYFEINWWYLIQSKNSYLKINEFYNGTNWWRFVQLKREWWY